MAKKKLAEVKPPKTEEEAEGIALADEVEEAIIAPLTSTKTPRATADCESARETACSCRCRGKYHGKPHPPGWKDELGCEPLNAVERKEAKKQALYSWRKAHPERVSAYMKGWREARKLEESMSVEHEEAVEMAKEALTEDAEGTEEEVEAE
jgi:hypothetical protein